MLLSKNVDAEWQLTGKSKALQCSLAIGALPLGVLGSA